MKARLLFALVGLAISFALPTYAQQTNTPDPKLRSQIKEVQASNNLVTVDEDSPHTLGTASNELWATGKWSQTLRGQNASMERKGYWSAVAILEGDDWSIRMLSLNYATRAPAATASPTASPSSQ